MARAFRYDFNKPAWGSTFGRGPDKRQTQWVLVAPTALQTPPHTSVRAGPDQDYLTSFQNDAFRRQAMTVKTARNSSTQTPRRTRVDCTGSDIHCK